MANKCTIEQLRKLQNLVLISFDNTRKWLENPETQKTTHELRHRIRYLRQQYLYLMQKIETSEVQFKVEGTFQCVINEAESVLRQLESNTRSVMQSPVKRSSTFVSPLIVSLAASFTADQSPAPPPAASSSLAASLTADQSPAFPPAASSISVASLVASNRSPASPIVPSQLVAPLVSSLTPNPTERFDKSLPTSVFPATATPAAQTSASESVTTSRSPHEPCVMISDVSVSSSTPLESKSSSTVSQAVTLASQSENQPESHPSCVLSRTLRASGHQSSAEISNDSSTATLASAAVTDTHSVLPMQRSIVNTASVNASSNVTAHSDESTPHPPSMAAYNAFTAPLRAPVITASSVVVPTCTSTVSSICTSLPTLKSASAALPETSVSVAATATLSAPPIPVRSTNDAPHDASSNVISCCNDPPTSTTASASTSTVSRISSAFSTLSFLPVSTQAMSASVAAFKAHHAPHSIVSAIPTHSYAQLVASNMSSVPVSARNAPTTTRNAPATANCAPVLTLHAPPVTALAVRVLTLPAPVPVASVTSYPALLAPESAFISKVPNFSTLSPAPVLAYTSVLAVPQEPLAPAATIVTIFARRTPVSSANTTPVHAASNVIVSSNEIAPNPPSAAPTVTFPAPSHTCISSASCLAVSTFATSAHLSWRIHAPTQSRFASYPAASCSAVSPPSYALPAPGIVSASVTSLFASVSAQEVAPYATKSVTPVPVTVAPYSAFVLQQAAPFSAQVSVNAPFVALLPVSAAQTAAQFAPTAALESAASISIESSYQITSHPSTAAAATASTTPLGVPHLLHSSKQSQLHCTTFSALQSASIVSNSAPESTASNDHAFGRQTTINTPSAAAALNATPSQHVSARRTASMLPHTQCRSTLPVSTKSSASAFLSAFIPLAVLLLTAFSAGSVPVSLLDQASESLTIPSHLFDTVADSSDSATSTTLNQLVAPFFIAYLPSTVRASILNSATEGLNSQFWATEDPHIDFYAHHVHQADIVACTLDSFFAPETYSSLKSLRSSLSFEKPETRVGLTQHVAIASGAQLAHLPCQVQGSLTSTHVRANDAKPFQPGEKWRRPFSHHSDLLISAGFSPTPSAPRRRDVYEYFTPHKKKKKGRLELDRVITA